MDYANFESSFHLIGESTRQRRNSTDVEYARPSSVGEEEIQLQLALAMSKEEHDESIKKQKSDDIKLQIAIEESRKQADEVGLKNAALLFCVNP